ncbi:MAG: AbrB family transcriptional regulator, partial [Alphaproteobacteria bacterium]
LEPAISTTLRTVMVTVLGVMLGAAFTPELLSSLGRWTGSLALLAAVIALMSAAAYVFFLRVGRYDPVTSYFASTPGGLTEMTLVGESQGGDVRRISLTHATRILIAVSLIPFYFRIIQGLDVPVMPAQAGRLLDLGWTDAGLLTACAALGLPLARLIKAPAAPLTGPMLLSAIVHGAGWSKAAPPVELIAAAQVVVGAAIGARFSGLTWASAGRTILLAAAAGVLMIGVAVLVSAFAAPWLGLRHEALFLSLAPGGIAEMAVIALSLGIDTAFVSAMHVIRIVLIVTLAPLAWRLTDRKAAGADAQRNESSGSRTAP